MKRVLVLRNQIKKSRRRERRATVTAAAETVTAEVSRCDGHRDHNCATGASPWSQPLFLSSGYEYIVFFVVVIRSVMSKQTALASAIYKFDLRRRQRCKFYPMARCWWRSLRSGHDPDCRLIVVGRCSGPPLWPRLVTWLLEPSLFFLLLLLLIAPTVNAISAAVTAKGSVCSGQLCYRLLCLPRLCRPNLSPTAPAANVVDYIRYTLGGFTNGIMQRSTATRPEWSRRIRNRSQQTIAADLTMQSRQQHHLAAAAAAVGTINE